ncbi:unnamed protein product, partial [Lampetra fluviatilis]
MLKTAAIFSLTVTWLCSCSCLESAQLLRLANEKFELLEKEVVEVVEVEEVDVKSMASAQAEFGLELFRILAKESPLENVFLSPLTTSVALMMLYAGAGSTTSETLSRVLRLTRLGASEPHSALGRLLRSLETRGDTKLAARIFTARGRVTLKKTFVDKVETNYGASPQGLLGPSSEDVKMINAWVERRTEGLVKNLLEDLPEETRLVLVSAIFYKGEWEVKFDAGSTQLRRFYLDETNSTHVFKVPFKGNKSMVVFLPDQMSPNLTMIVDSLTPELISGLLAGGLRKKRVTLQMPRMELMVDSSLESALSKW